ncbi:MAG: hypothetical protein IT458_19010 [Planctomycetes bacterium]|nr:hypothetical protein [Planctomycetota bacterium]
MGRSTQRRDAGFTFAELAFGILVFVIGVVTLANHLSINYSSTQLQKDRVFAYTKAQALLAEIHAYVDRGEISAAIDLDALDDGVVNKTTLTLSREGGVLVAPDHPLSGNLQRSGQWLWSRRISVQPFSGLNNRNVRYVTVRIYRRDGAGVEHIQASLSSVVNSVGSAFPSTQVFDMYFLAVENVPGWWVYMEAIRPFMEASITDLEGRNPGLDIRTHWITKSSYGRNGGYMPYINVAQDSRQDVRYTYWYPGLMPAGSNSTYYYVPDMFKARMSFDGVETNGYDATTNPLPYALADTYNHAMRYPRERALHDQRIAVVQQRAADIATAKKNNTTVPPELVDMSEEPTYRLFLEDLCTNPDKYRNAMIINLHGELMPFPPLRNYSDPAKDPADLPYVRVVTHPEQLRTTRDPLGVATEDVVLRVYAWNTIPASYTGPQVMPANRPIAIQVMGVDLTDGLGGLIPGASIENLRGGVLVGGSSAYAPFTASKTTSDPRVADEMYYEAAFIDPGVGQEKFTLIRLFHTPVVATYAEDEPIGTGVFRGLQNNLRSRLYGLEYIPSCTEAGMDFSRDLYAAGDGPKNSARWRIRIPASVYSSARFVRASDGSYYDPAADVVLTVCTRIWDEGLGKSENLAQGVWFPAPDKPENFSETYTWWCDDPSDVPVTERAQFQGDPRHNPYKDLCNGVTAEFANGYNPYFTSLNATAGLTTGDARPDFPGIESARVRERWMSRLRPDLPRLMEVVRTGLVNSGAIYTSLTGFSYYYVGFGGEIGYDSANGYPSSIPCDLRPFGSPGATGYVNIITGSQMVVRSGLNPYWWGMTWLGELYPDWVYTGQWEPSGNLLAGTGSSAFFFRQAEGTAYINSGFLALGTTFASGIRRTQEEGSTTLFNIGTSASTFHHQYADGQTGTLTAVGTELATNYNFPVPTIANISRPFRLNTNASGGVGPEWAYTPYSTNRYVGSIVRTYYNHATGAQGSSLVKLQNPAATAAAYILVNGLDKTVDTGSAFIARYALISLVHSFFEGGTATVTNRIKMPPRVQIESPTEITELINPSSIPVQWDIDWMRWDGLKYTGNTSGTFAETEAEVEYVLYYSRDLGQTWLHIQDGTQGTPGVKPANPGYVLGDSAAGPETFNWDVSDSQFVEGSYLLRIEAYRTNQALHYSQHQVKIYINR